jgi:hypothetical protein
MTPFRMMTYHKQSLAVSCPSLAYRLTPQLSIEARVSSFRPLLRIPNLHTRTLVSLLPLMLVVPILEVLRARPVGLPSSLRLALLPAQTWTRPSKRSSQLKEPFKGTRMLHNWILKALPTITSLVIHEKEAKANRNRAKIRFKTWLRLISRLNDDKIQSQAKRDFQPSFK